MLSVFAQLERDQTRERIRDGLSFKKQKGEWIGRPPYGFSILKRTDGKGGVIKDKHLTINQDESKIVKAIFQARAKGKGLTDICRILERKRINERKWSPIGVWKILNNKTYLGNGTHEKIVSRKLFDQAQQGGRK